MSDCRVDRAHAIVRRVNLRRSTFTVRMRLACVLAVAAALALPAAAGAQSADSCAPTDLACFDALPANTLWRQAIRLPEVPNKYQGSTVTVAVLDTGITPSDDFLESFGNRILARVDLTAEHDGIDHYGHGTHMAGLVAGNGNASGGAFEGAGPEANVVSVKVAGWDGATDVSTVIAGLQWVVANRQRFGIRVVNLSFGTDSIQPADVDPLNDAVERAWRAGILVVVSAGNAGSLAGTVTKPGDDPYVVTVGAADLRGTTDPADDEVASFSSRGGGKPDLVAPGIALVSQRAPGSTVDVFRAAARVGAAYFKGTGTSQAAAVVSGVAARMFDANPTLTPDQAKAVLVATANPALAGQPGAGAGLLDAAAAVAAVAQQRIGDVRAYPMLPSANAGLVSSTGLGSLQASRGSQQIVADLDGDGVAEPVQGEVDVLGQPWDPATAAAGWSADGFAASAWAPRVAEPAGAAPAPAWSGPSTSVMAWEAKYWGASGWLTALWDAKYWGAKYWGASTWE
jgi:serine protease AprX